MRAAWSLTDPLLVEQHRQLLAGVLVAEQQFRWIIGDRDLAKLVQAAPKDHVHQEIAEMTSRTTRSVMS